MNVHGFGAAAVATAIALATSFVATRAAIRIARRRRMLDVPNERSSHTVPTPRTGGVGIALGAAAALAIRGPYTPQVAAAAAGAAVAFAAGLLDDVRTLRPAPKMALLLVAAAFAAAGMRVERTGGVPFSGEVSLGVLAWPLTILWLAGYANAFNFMDGIDGIAGVTAAVSAASFAAAGIVHGDDTLVGLSAAVGGASLGFLPWNFPRAAVFMGDAGSLPLGMLLAAAAVEANASGAMSFPASVLLLGPFVFDVAFTLALRAVSRRRLSEAHRDHLYQRLSRVLRAHAPVTIAYALFAAVTGLLALTYERQSELGRLLSLGIPPLAMLAFAASVLRAERRREG